MFELSHKDFKLTIQSVFKDLKKIFIVIERWEISANKWKI